MFLAHILEDVFGGGGRRGPDLLFNPIAADPTGPAPQGKFPSSGTAPFPCGGAVFPSDLPLGTRPQCNPLTFGT